MPPPTLSDEAQFARNQLAFKVEIINAHVKKMTLRLAGLITLTTTPRVGTGKQQIPVSGPEDFEIVAALLHEVPGKPTRIKLRIAPKKREEYRYAEIFLDRDMGSFVVCYMTDSGRAGGSYMGWEGAYDVMLAEIEPVSKRTYGELVDLAVNAERNRIVKQGMQHNANFGIW